VRDCRRRPYARNERRDDPGQRPSWRALKPMQAMAEQPQDADKTAGHDAQQPTKIVVMPAPALCSTSGKQPNRIRTTSAGPQKERTAPQSLAPSPQQQPARLASSKGERDATRAGRGGQIPGARRGPLPRQPHTQKIFPKIQQGGERLMPILKSLISLMNSSGFRSILMFF
jgi:hypothetical protein